MTNERGTRWETAIVSYLRSEGAVQVERRARTGAKDRGDLAGLPGVVVEAKNAQRTELAAWLSEAKREANHDGADIGVVWAHRRGKGSPADGYVVMDGATFVRLLRQAGRMP